jgi:AraC-like DNA-binding protein
MPSANDSGLPVIRLAHPLGFAAFLEHLGAPVDGYFRRQGLPVLCKDPNAFVPLKKAWAFFDDAARREDPAVGWQVGRFVGDRKLNAALLQKLEGAPTLYQALHALIRLVNSESSHLRLGILEGRHRIRFYTAGYAELKNEPGFTSSQAYQLAVYIDLIRHFAGQSWVPENIGIHDSTAPAVIEEHFPGCRVRAGQPISYLAIPRSCLHLQVRIRHVESSAATPLILTDDLNFAEALSLLLKPYLPQGYPSVSFAASLADTSARTLARRLSECGKTYQCVVDEARFSVARELLRDTDEQVSEIAGSVGFSDQANFSRFFQRVGGLA